MPESLYAHPRVYDVAHDFRDYAWECDAVLAWAARVLGRPPRRALEVACGPAYHACELGRRGLEVHGLDLSPLMGAYARERAARAGVRLETHAGDMMAFDLADPPFDLALCMIDSTLHVPTVDRMVDHLRAVARHLGPSGAYVIEQNHPAQYLGRRALVDLEWTERDPETGLEVWIRYEDPGARLDPITQIASVTVTTRVREPGRPERRLVDETRLRVWLAGEMEAAIRLSGAFAIAARHADFEPDAPFDDGLESWRMIHVLRKTA